MIKLIKLDDTYLYKVKIENTRAMREICSQIHINKDMRTMSMTSFRCLYCSL